MFLTLAKTCLRAGLSVVPLGVYRRVIRRDCVGFCYHIVSAGHPPHTMHLGPHKTPTQFETDLGWLKAHYEVIGYEELCQRRQVSGTGCQVSDVREQRPAMIVTFDDGLREHLTIAAPLLKQYGIPAVFFITTGFLDNQRLFYRHKVSLCLEAAQHQSDADLRSILDHLTESREQRAESREPNTKHQALSTKDQAPLCSSATLEPCTLANTPDSATQRLSDLATFGSPLSALRSLLSSLTIAEEPLIDEACYLLGIDCDRFLREQRPYLTPDEVQQLAADGFTIGAHGVTHARLKSREPGTESGEQRAEGQEQSSASQQLRTKGQAPRTRGQSPLCHSAAREPCDPLASSDFATLGLSDLATIRPLTPEIVDSCRLIASLTGTASVPFAFPFSGDEVSRTELRAIREQHPEVGLLFDRRGFRRDEPFIVHRIVADNPPDSPMCNLPNLLRREYQRQACWTSG